jgi:hypothetical protein
MSIEVPVLRLGLAGYTEAHQKAAWEAAVSAGTTRALWVLGAFGDADAWWLDGSRTMLLPNQHLRVQPAVPSARSVHIALSDVDRPIAFSLPVTAPGLKPAVSFRLGDRAATARVLQQFADLMQPMLSQFALASSIAEHQPSLSSGAWELLRGSDLLAVVDLKLGAGVKPGVTHTDFAGASWCIRNHGAVSIPASYHRCSISQLMWQYAQRTERDLLPPHYRTQPLYFRRPPRLPQRLLKDAHLLLMRELLARPGMDFDGLQQASGLANEPLARCLSALYVVGSITSNRKRALASTLPGAAPGTLAGDGESSLPNSLIDPVPRPLPARPVSDLTAPLPLMPER